MPGIKKIAELYDMHAAGITVTPSFGNMVSRIIYFGAVLIFKVNETRVSFIHGIIIGNNFKFSLNVMIFFHVVVINYLCIDIDGFITELILWIIILSANGAYDFKMAAELWYKTFTAPAAQFVFFTYFMVNGENALSVRGVFIRME